jgi:hypothetical protein
MHLAQEISRRKVMPWLKPEQEEGERQYRAVALRFVQMGNNFLTKLADAGLSELTRMPHALDPEKGFRVRSRFIFEDFIGTAQPPSPLRWLADIFLPFVGARKVITNEAREFLRELLEVNSSRVQNDVLNRIQESRDRLQVEIRKLLHEISRIAEQALDRARRVKEEGTSQPTRTGCFGTLLIPFRLRANGFEIITVFRRDLSMKPRVLNLLFLVVGVIGLGISLHYWSRSHRNPWLLGIGLFVYFIISSFSEMLSQLRKR